MFSIMVMQWTLTSIPTHIISRIFPIISHNWKVYNIANMIKKECLTRKNISKQLQCHHYTRHNILNQFPIITLHSLLTRCWRSFGSLDIISKDTLGYLKPRETPRRCAIRPSLLGIDTCNYEICHFNSISYSYNAK
jgi:hypothetical protein